MSVRTLSESATPTLTVVDCEVKLSASAAEGASVDDSVVRLRTAAGLGTPTEATLVVAAASVDELVSAELVIAVMLETPAVMTCRTATSCPSDIVTLRLRPFCSGIGHRTTASSSMMHIKIDVKNESKIGGLFASGVVHRFKSLRRNE